MSEHSADSNTIRDGLKHRKEIPPGVALYNARWDPVPLRNFYAGRSAFLILSGPSLNLLNLNRLDQPGVLTMGVNNSWSVYRPHLWACVDHPRRFIDTGWKDGRILKFAPASHAALHLGVQGEDGRIRNSAFKAGQMPSTLFYRRTNGFDHTRFLRGESVMWGCGNKQADTLGLTGKRSVMLVALRLLHHLGFRTVYLLGCDFAMSEDRRYAFDETRTDQAIRNNNSLYDGLRRRFEALRPHFDAEGFRVVNCSPGSALDTFDRMDFADAVEQSASECSKPVGTRGWYEAIKAVSS